MASHGSKRHQKRLARPVVVPISAKGSRYIMKGTPGAHAEIASASVLVLLRDLLKVARSSREARKLMRAGEVLVDGKPVSDLGFGAGLMDVVAVPKAGVLVRIVNNHGKLSLAKISEADAKVKLCRIANKKIVAGGKVQLNLHDGRNVLIEKEEDRFKTGDTVKLSIPAQKLSGFLKFEKGAECYVFRGKHAGGIATLDELKEREGSRPTEAVLSGKDGKFITLKDYLFVVDKGFKLD
ncbi:MAG: 30S ribosomal protein S4e [Candidatus Micrarchaeia archaeon]|jgi:small subunit ribosomal protein S4e